MGGSDYRSCYLCDKRKADGISLHKFPKNPILKNKWLEACDLSTSDDVRNVYLCSTHFVPENVKRGSKTPSLNLKRTSVPSIGVPNPICSSIKSHKTSNSNKENSLKYNRPKGNISKKKRQHETANESVLQNSTPENIVEEVILSENIVNIEESEGTDEATVENTNVITSETEDDEETNEPSTKNACENAYSFGKGPANSSKKKVKKTETISHEASCPLKRVKKYAGPRDVAELVLDDFKNPEIAEKMLKMVLETDKKKSKLIKNLQSRNRELQKRRIVALAKKKDVGLEKDKEESLEKSKLIKSLRVRNQILEKQATKLQETIVSLRSKIDKIKEQKKKKTTRIWMTKQEASQMRKCGYKLM